MALFKSKEEKRKNKIEKTKKMYELTEIADEQVELLIDAIDVGKKSLSEKDIKSLITIIKYYDRKEYDKARLLENTMLIGKLNKCIERGTK